jgi:hypothetical protein
VGVIYIYIYIYIILSFFFSKLLNQYGFQSNNFLYESLTIRMENVIEFLWDILALVGRWVAQDLFEHVSSLRTLLYLLLKL